MICLDDRYSTTRRVRKVAPEVVLAEIKAEQKLEDKFETVLFLPEGEGRQVESGLRTKGYFKKSEEDKPLITVVTVVFNGEAHLEETILSVINQTYDNVEYIVIDGASTDGTVDIIRKYEHAIDYWVSETDGGIYYAMNKGITLTQGSYLIFVNAGDIFTQDAGYFFNNELKNISAEIIVSGYEIKNKKKYVPLRPYGWKLPSSHNSILYSGETLKKFPFDCSYKVAADFDQFLKIKKKIYFTNLVLMIVRDDGFVMANKRKSFSEYSDILFKQGKYLYALYWFLRYSLVSFLR